MLIMMLVTISDSILASLRWFHLARKPIDQWASTFSWIDLTLAILAILNGENFFFPLFIFIFTFIYIEII